MKKEFINLASQAQKIFKDFGMNVEIPQIKAAYFDGQIFFLADVPQGSNLNQYPCIIALSDEEPKVQMRLVRNMYILDEYHHLRLARTEWVYAKIEGGKDFALVTDVIYRDMLKQKRGEKQSCARV